MSSHLVWSIIRNNHAYLLKKRNIKKPFSTEPANLTNLNSFRYNGIVHKKTLRITNGPDRKGFSLIRKKVSKQRKPRQNQLKNNFISGPRRTLPQLKRLLQGDKYRSDLTKVAIRRASAILKSQKPLPVKKPAKAD